MLHCFFRSLLGLTPFVREKICDVVADIFNKSLRSGDVPLDWKLANISAAFKKRQKVKFIELQAN